MRDPNPHLRATATRASVRLAREVADIQRTEVASMPTNFLPPEQRTTTTTPAGESAYTIADPRPHRLDPNVERLRERSVRPRGRLPPATERHPPDHARTRTFDVPPVFVPVRRLDAAGGPRTLLSTGHVPTVSPTDTWVSHEPPPTI